MAGIGFELKKLFRATGVLSMLKAYGYTGMVTAGPMLLGVIFLLSINYIGKMAGLNKSDQDLLVCMITYCLLGSMMLNSIFSMVMTRYVADLLYEEKEKDVIPSMEGILGIMLPLGGIFWIIFLGFAGIDLMLCILNFILFMELIVAWTQMNYLTAVKDYKGILLSYVYAIILSVLTALFGCAYFGASLYVLMLSVSAGYGVMIVYDMILLYEYFPNSMENHFAFLPWFDEYRDLMFIGFFTNLGLFSHIVIAWMSDVGVNIKGLYYGAPQHDVAALFAFITILITTINFVASVEVNFYPKYRKYYDLFNGTGSIIEIEAAENEMITVLEHELAYTARIQFYATALILSIGLVFLERLPLGFDSLMEGYFRILSVGYGAYAVGNVLMLILMYFTDYADARRSAFVFGTLSTVLSAVSLMFESKYYGFAFAISSIVYLVFTLSRLMDYTKKLPYHILSSQPIVAERKYGFGSRLYEFMEKHAK
ncbi:MAG: exopolysaccharide Pel transporter PelG [Butyrivibrio sp.]|uniref:exopolysaccharide Pel transporter PelG n=1 Tax=Butyrivibrio sp. TaxID=28121 RepID=UPI001B2EBB1D|nr:exopolysaccharide Pel transporter PelG [Butyrivibrio sp.]MBO6240263.1 exopolysaccharide Pel transporter PelG [Butyrivibrio sp.]